MQTLLMSIIPGAMLAAGIDYFTHLSGGGFLFVMIGGMMLYTLLIHLLSSLYGSHTKHNPFERDQFDSYRTRLY